MKKLVSLTAMCVALVLVMMPLAYAQAEKGAEKGAPQAEKTFQGQLTKVDASAKKISVKGSGNAEMMFAYTDQTQVNGPEKDIQGLASQTGSELKITYRDAGGGNLVATRIDVLGGAK